MLKAGRILGWGALRLLLPLLAGALVVTSPAQAQFSQGYKFLEAVRKKDGLKVEQALNKPGSTIINARDVTTGETAMHIVTKRRDLVWMRYLIQKGVNVNTPDGNGVTPLQLATNLGYLDGVKLLVAADADLDASNDAGETPLIAAIHRRNVAMVRALLDAGANPDRADNSGRTARDYAELAGSGSQILAEIQSHDKEGRGKGKPKAVYGPTL